MPLSDIYIYPFTDGATSGTWARGGAGAETTYSGILSAHPWDVTDDAHYCRGNGAAAAEATLAMVPDTMPDVLSITSVSLVHRSRGAGGATNVQTDFRLATIITAASWQAAVDSVWNTRTRAALTTVPATGLPFTKTDLENNFVLHVQDTDAGGQAADFSKAYAKVIGTLAPVQLADYRRVGSLYLWFRRISARAMEYVVPAELALRLIPGDYMPMTEFTGAHESDAGWGGKCWQARPGWIKSIALDDKYGRIIVTDARSFLCLWRDTARCDSDATGMMGVSRFDLGCGRTFTRGGNAHPRLPVAAGAFAPARFDESAPDMEVFDCYSVASEPYTSEQLHEEERYNEVPYSSFKDGSGAVFTGWTSAGAGTLSELTTDDVLQFMHIGRCPQLMDTKTLTSTATASLAANTVVSLLIDVYLSAMGGTSCGVQVTRGVDGWYLDPATKTWQVGAVSVLGGIGPYGFNGAFTLEGFSVGANPTTLTVTFGTVGGGAVHAWAVPRHVQIEIGAFCTSRIVTGAARVARGASRLLISNNAAARCVNNAQGGWLFHVRPRWTSAQLGNANAVIAFVGYDANNYRLLQYNGTSDRWEHTVCVGGVASTAYLADTITGQDTYRIGGRWTGANAELDLSPYTVSVHVAKVTDAFGGTMVKGTDVVCSAAPTEAATCDMEIGSRAAAESWNGWIWNGHSFVQVPTDIEFQRGW